MDSETASRLISAVYSGYSYTTEDGEYFDTDLACDNVIKLVGELMARAWDLGRAEGYLSYRPKNPYRSGTE